MPFLVRYSSIIVNFAVVDWACNGLTKLYICACLETLFLSSKYSKSSGS